MAARKAQPRPRGARRPGRPSREPGASGGDAAGRLTPPLRRRWMAKWRVRRTVFLGGRRRPVPEELLMNFIPREEPVPGEAHAESPASAAGGSKRARSSVSSSGARLFAG